MPTVIKGRVHDPKCEINTSPFNGLGRGSGKNVRTGGLDAMPQ